MTLFLSVVKAWCKKQWKLITGFLVGVATIFLLTRKKTDETVLIKKQEMVDKDQESIKEHEESRRESVERNITIFLEEQKDIESDFSSKIKKISDNEVDEVDRILKSDDPAIEISRRLKALLGD